MFKKTSFESSETSESSESSHAILSPSSSHRWLACPASAVWCSVEKLEPSEIMLEGKLAHKLAEEMLSEADPKKISNQYSPEMIRQVQKYVSYVQSFSGDLYVEQILPVKVFTNELNAVGTCDALVFEKNTLHVFDLKYGMKYVSSKNNSQLLIYALAALYHFNEVYPNIENVELHIYQPRLSKSEVSNSIYSLEELIVFLHLIISIAKDCVKCFGIYNSGGIIPEDMYTKDTVLCSICPGKIYCPVFSKKFREGMMKASELTRYLQSEADKEAIELTIQRKVEICWKDEDISDFISFSQSLESLRKNIEKVILNRFNDGDPIPHIHIRDGNNGRYRYKNPENVLNLLESFNFKKEDYCVQSPKYFLHLIKDLDLSDEQYEKLKNETILQKNKPSIRYTPLKKAIDDRKIKTDEI